MILLMPPRSAPAIPLTIPVIFPETISDSIPVAAPVSSSVVWGRFTGFNAFSLWHLQAVGGGHHPLSSLPPVSRSLVFGLPYASIFRHHWGYSFLSVQSATCRTLCDRPPQVLVLSEVPDSCLSVGGGRLPPRFKFVQLLFRGVSEDSDVGS